MEDLCKRCGKCCQAIVSIHSTQEQLNDSNIARMVEDYKSGKLSEQDVAKIDSLFAVLNFEEITKEDAIKVNPHLAEVAEELHFYRCKRFDAATNLCTTHDDRRPKFCHYAPLYNFTLKEYVDMPYMDWYMPTCNYARVWEERKAKVLDARARGIKVDSTGANEHCAKCGKCCEVIVMNLPMQNYPAHFEMITETEAFRLNPHLKDIEPKNKYYYKCRELDPRTKLCRIHERRPEFCCKYPQFGESELGLLLSPDDIYVPECGIIRELRRRCFGSEEL